MAKKTGKLARRYARAFLAVVSEGTSDVAGQKTKAQEIAESLSSFAQAWEDDQELPLFFLNPMIPAESRGKTLAAAATQAGMPEITISFLNTLVERDRLSALPEIAVAFEQLADEAAGVVKVLVTTASDVDGSERSEIESMFSSVVEGRPEFSWDVDSNLIGGMTISYGGKVIDGSLSGRIERIERSLLV